MLVCDLCRQDIDPEDEDIQRDDSGDYHQPCLDEYWAPTIAQVLAEYRRPDPEGGYEWGDPKNPKYMDSIHNRLDIKKGK